MSASLVGSEMCIRDSPVGDHNYLSTAAISSGESKQENSTAHHGCACAGCLLYTSDAADDM
eukprot:5251936-Alexandrium_andersonii.AAC.1